MNDSEKCKKVALTFDDGPCRIYTPKVLRILNDFNIRATFFMIGNNAERCPEVVKEIIGGNHLIGNHGNSHRVFRSFFPSSCIKEIRGAEGVFFRLTGLRPRFYRPPKGLTNWWVRQTVRERGYYTVLWSHLLSDFRFWHTASHIMRQITGVKDGSILVLHDGLNLKEGQNRDIMIKALPGIIDWLQGHDFTVVTLTELLDVEPYF